MSTIMMNFAIPLSLLATPVAPAEQLETCSVVSEISFKSTPSDIVIAGDLAVPIGTDGKRPAIMMITGSGPHTREQRISDTPMFSMLADFFVQRGFVVLRTDARGFGKSTGPDDFEQTTTAERLEDNRAALAYLFGRPEVDAQRVIVFGHSEGAMLAAMLGRENPNLSELILLSTSALPGEDVMAYQQTAGLRKRGQAEAAEAVAEQFRVFARFLASGSNDPEEFHRIARAFLNAHGPEAEKLDTSIGEKAIGGFLNSRWDRWFVGYDPSETLGHVTVPVLAVFAEYDENTPWRQHLPALVTSMVKAKNADFTTTVLPNQDHFYLEYEGERLVRHQPGKMAVSGELYDLLEAELKRRFGADVQCRPK